MSITTLTRRLALLRRSVDRAPYDDIDLALCVVEIKIDALHGERGATEDEIHSWFLENYDGPIERHADYIREGLDCVLAVSQSC